MCQAFGECSETSNSKKEVLPGRVVLNAPVMSVSLESFVRKVRKRSRLASRIIPGLRIKLDHFVF